MKKARMTSARASAKKTAGKPAVRETPTAAKSVVEKTPSPPPAVEAEPAFESARPKRGLGRLGLKTLDRPEIVPSLTLIPSSKAQPVQPLVPAALLSSSPPSSKKKSAAAPMSGETGEQYEPALVLYLRDELRSLLNLLDEAPPSL